MTDFGALFSQLFSTFWWLLPLFGLAALFKSAWFKGVMGEAMVNLAARLFLNKNDYHLIKNVTIPTEDGTTQIDHIIVSRFGVFVVETKNMKGWIFGSANQKQWTQQIYKSKHRFQNPLHQNYKHTKTLETALGLAHEKMFSVVVFVGDSTFKTDMPENVTYGGGYIRYIKSKTQILLTETEVQQIIGQIAEGRLKPSLKTSREHAKHVRRCVAAKSELAESPATKSCPKCGSEMVLRTSKKGPQAGNQFWGCSAFPKCKTLENIG
ncbi:DNA topoisomerase I [Mariprofundus micogutta]|uniref:DNA topoisomerase I n=1 Tax=Mariprofundus micogutta TaxID=1921010 RepID=A0A1L8CQ35_9PROT|nr:NERD domain-containing protein [Mariprofundus micogutta]GAV20994.1 DNA topoisomerase I [Mariprofundus micogutta]